MSDKICQSLKQPADPYPSPWKILENDQVRTIVFMKASADGKRIDGLKLKLGALERENGKHEFFASESSSFAFVNNKPFCKLLGITTRNMEDASQLKPSQESRSKAIEWAENEILTTQAISQWVGSSVDEYLVCFDGTICRLASNKKLKY